MGKIGKVIGAGIVGGIAIGLSKQLTKATRKVPYCKKNKKSVF